MDVVYGPVFGSKGRDFKKKHEYSAAKCDLQAQADPTAQRKPSQVFEGGLGVNNAYSDNFSNVHLRFQPGWAGRIFWCLVFPGKDASWVRKIRKAREGPLATPITFFDVVDNESPGLADITGDGKPELLCCSGGFIGYCEADWKNPDSPWTFSIRSVPRGDYQRFTHGIGLWRHQWRWPDRHPRKRWLVGAAGFCKW